jgi:hypothetical protein
MGSTTQELSTTDNPAAAAIAIDLIFIVVLLSCCVKSSDHIPDFPSSVQRP